MSRYIHFDTDKIEPIEGFHGSETIMTPSFVFFWKSPSIFGQWTDSPFTIDGVEYSCAEQYMMAEKARLFKDIAIEQQILKTSNPRQHKSLGRKVKGFEKSIWEEKRLEIVIRGNQAKFRQNSSMRRELLHTGARELVEASPMDRIWGIGLRGDNPLVTEKTNWKGLNLLGIALMEVRQLLAKESS